MSRYAAAYRKGVPRPKKKLCETCQKVWYARYVIKYRRKKDVMIRYRAYQKAYRRRYRQEGRDQWLKGKKSAA